MEHINQKILGQFESLLTKEHRKLLLFLYEKLQIEALSEEEQTNFMEYFTNEETLCDIASFKSSLEEMIQEMEDNLPEIELEEYVRNNKKQKYKDQCKLYEKERNEMKKQTIKKGNIIYVPFHK